MQTPGLLSLAKLILPKDIIDNFEVVSVIEDNTSIRIYLDECSVKQYADNPRYESKGFRDAITLRDFPIRDKAVDLVVRRRRWLDKETGTSFSNTYDLKADGTRYSKEFAAFLKELYGDDPYNLPFA